MKFDTLQNIASDPASALEIGKAAEHLVCANLILNGFRCYLSDQGLPYDVVVDLDGRLIRIQVKASCFARNVNMKGRAERTAYTFSVRRRGKDGSKRLNDADCDAVAMVALDIQEIAYFPISYIGQTCQLMPPGFVFRGKYKRNKFLSVDGFPFARLVPIFLGQRK